MTAARMPAFALHLTQVKTMPGPCFTPCVNHALPLPSMSFRPLCKAVVRRPATHTGRLLSASNRLCYMRMRLVNSKDEPQSDWSTWPAADAREPDEAGDDWLLMWNSARHFSSGADADVGGSASVRLWSPRMFVLFELRQSVGDQLIGSAQVALYMIGSGGSILALRHSLHGKQGSCVVRALPAGKRHKRIFLVRHGESSWNEAQARKDLPSLIGQHDHPLTMAGFKQARALRDAILSAQCSGAAVPLAVRQLLGVTAVWASPLTRALQTAMVSMQPLTVSKCCQPPKPISLRVNARERQKLGSADCTGVATNDECGVRAAQQLQQLVTSGITAGPVSATLGRAIRYFFTSSSDESLAANDRAEAAEAARAAAASSLDVTEVQRRWWLSGAEDLAALDGRIATLLEQVEHSPDDSIVIVGHSHFFRQLFRNHLSSALRSNSPALASTLCDAKLTHCAVACCDVNFALHPKVIVGASVLQAEQDAERRYELRVSAAA